MTTIRSLPTNDAYRAGWDAIFGKREAEEVPAVFIESTLTPEQATKVIADGIVHAARGVFIRALAQQSLYGKHR